MWIPRSIFDLFTISKETVDSLRTELAAVRAERDSLRSQLATTAANFDWLRVAYNQAQNERAALLQKNYGINVPAPELIPTTSQRNADPSLDELSFEDMGDQLAKKFGFPIYDQSLANQ